jgi:hypothetical protein
MEYLDKFFIINEPTLNVAFNVCYLCGQSVPPCAEHICKLEKVLTKESLRFFQME